MDFRDASHLGETVGHSFLGSVERPDVGSRAVRYAQDAGARDEMAARIMRSPRHRRDQHRHEPGRQQVPDLPRNSTVSVSKMTKSRNAVRRELGCQQVLDLQISNA